MYLEKKNWMRNVLERNMLFFNLDEWDVHLVGALAEILYEGKDFLIVLDMSVYSSHDSVKYLMRTSYRHNNVEGQLSEVVKRRPFSIVMFRNFEKTHESVTDLLVEISNCDRIRDGLGNEVDFSNTIIIITLKLKRHHGNYTLTYQARLENPCPHKESQQVPWPDAPHPSNHTYP
ncbi:ATPase, AAA-2 [Corchorus olitorius]|uniref:ATPase, AAA-2 n=1 Tax=Corchorus olitorius TaxID=93759 RepID=A0A1R3K5Y7_9ROSI|nr:ATPase, AAA-2 [Corchorus olitorius]